ncbi:DUF1294 domain-containing protein [Virgibacillus kimchii]
MNNLSMLLFYIIAVNVLVFIIMGVDKRKAVKRKYRVPERTFWMLAALGGSLGVMFGMNFHRHKTRHTSFKIGMPIMLVLNIVLAGYLFNSMS